ncbi:MAG TPA: hypothetical protein VGE41_13190 [Verrucomicrobiae bacterium]
MKSIAYSLRLVGALLLGINSAAWLRAEVDDFSSGNDNLWTHSDPLRGFGVGGTGTWSVVNGAYRIQASPCQNPATYGPGRAGSLLTGVTYSQFYLTVDLVNWDNSLDQIFGILTRVSNPGLGTLNGYGFTYATRTGRNAFGELELLRITNEGGTDMTTALNISLNPVNHYRMVFVGSGSDFTGMLFQLPDVTTPIATLFATDATYATGNIGLFTYDNSSTKNHAADSTFDNFAIANVAPPRLSVSVDQFSDLSVTWPSPAPRYLLQTAGKITGPWTTVDSSQIVDANGLYSYNGSSASGNLFFRLQLH